MTLISPTVFQMKYLYSDPFWRLIMPEIKPHFDTQSIINVESGTETKINEYLKKTVKTAIRDWILHENS